MVKAISRVVLLVLLLAGCDSAEERKISHFEDGQRLMAEGDVDKAMVAFRNALRIDDRFAEPYLELGRIFMARNNASQAAAHLTKFVELRPDEPGARLDLGEVLLGVLKVDDASGHIEAALQLEPGNPRGLALRSAVQIARGEIAEAAASARAALDADPDQAIAWLTLIVERIRAEDFDGALARLDAAVARIGEDPVLSTIRLGIYERQGDREAVGALLRRLLGEFPDNREIARSLVRWHMTATPPEVDEAEALLRALSEANPGDFDEAMQLVGFVGAARGPRAARAELDRLAAAQGAGLAFDRALAAFDASVGDRAAAIARLEAGIAAREGTEEADAGRVQLARILDPVAEAGRRMELVTAVLARDPRNVGALGLRADARIREDRYAEAIQDLRTALTEAPQSADLLELLAVAHERDGSPQLARERRTLAAQVSDYAPEPTLRLAGILYGDGEFATAEDVLGQSLNRHPGHRGLLTALAEVRLARGDRIGAEAVARTFAESGDGSAVGQRIRAAALLQEGRLQEGSALLRGVWEASGGGADLEALVRTHIAAGERDKAEELVASALAADPANRAALLLLAGLRQAEGDAAGTLAVIERAVAARPGDGDLHATLAQLRLAAGDEAGARAAIEQGLQASPDNRPLRFRQARLLETDGDFDGAIAAYERLYAEQPGDLIVANNLASLLAGHRDDAASFTRAAAVARRLRDSEVPALRDTYGWTRFRIGEHAEALAVLRQSTAVLDGEALAHFHLGMAYEASGDGEAARNHLERALELADAGSTFHPRARGEAQAALARLPAQQRGQ